MSIISHDLPPTADAARELTPPSPSLHGGIVTDPDQIAAIRARVVFGAMPLHARVFVETPPGYGRRTRLDLSEMPAHNGPCGIGAGESFVACFLIPVLVLLAVAAGLILGGVL